MAKLARPRKLARELPSTDEREREDPGKYIFRFADADSSRKVINVLSADGKRSLAMLHTIPNQVMKAPKDPEIRFMETSARVPPPIKTWWYAGLGLMLVSRARV